MKQDIIKEKLNYLHGAMERLDTRLREQNNSKFKISDEVQHSLIWAGVVIGLALIICGTIIYF